MGWVRLVVLSGVQAACLASPPSSTGPGGAPDGGGAGHSIQFSGNAYQQNGVDRVWILAERPNGAGRLGADDFTVELWLKTDGETVAGTGGCPAYWWTGTIVLDREFYMDPPQNGNIGISLYRASGITGVAVGFEVAGVSEVNLCGDAEVGDGRWHHIAMVRDSDNVISIWVDGALDAQALGPSGDGSFAADLGPDIDAADAYLVLGGPKQGASADPGFTGWIDELRLSDDRLYDGPFEPPYPPLAIVSNDTVGLWRFDEDGGLTAKQAAGDGSDDGELRVGGDPTGPAWSNDVPTAE